MKKWIFNEKVLQYKQTNENLENLVHELAIHVYSLLKDKFKLDDEERSEFFCEFYPKLPSLINRFKYNSTPFEGYLTSSIRWDIKYFRSKKSKLRGIEKAKYTEPFYLLRAEEDFTIVHNEDLQISDKARPPLRLSKRGRIFTDPIKQRILYIYLLEAENTDDNLKNAIIKATGYKKKWLDNCTDKLRAKTDKRILRIKLLRNRRNSTFFNLHLLQEKLNFSDNKNEKKELIIKIERLRNIISKVNNQISKAPSRPTHQDLADVLGIPRGSIDSGIYYLKSAFEYLKKDTA